MTRCLAGMALLLCAPVFLGAETWEGTLIDAQCKGKDVAGHTTPCAIACAKGGYGLVTSDGRFLKFDDAGNAKALAALKETKKEKNLRARVTGKRAGDALAVDSIRIE